MRISVVVPVLNEAESVTPLFEKVSTAVEQLRGQYKELESFEVIFVDDGSKDESWKVIGALVDKNPAQIKALRFRRNFGKAAALTAGFKEASGDIIFTMDADLQDDPAEMPRFIEKLHEGYDLVSGWKKIRHDPVDKTLPSRCFNALTRALTGVKLHDFNCGYKAYRHEVAKSLTVYGELYRFIPVFAHADGFRVTEIPVQHHARKFGKSKYGWERFAKGFIDLLSVAAMTKFGRRPAHLFGGFGLIVGAVGLGVLGWLWWNQLFGHYIGGRPLFFFGILCTLLSAQMLCTGILAELFLRQSGGVVIHSPVVEKKGFNEDKR